MVKLNLFERFRIARSELNGSYLITSLDVWGRKRDQYIEKYRKTGLIDYEYKARECWDEYCEILDRIAKVYADVGFISSV